MKNPELFILWLGNFFAALVVVCARIGYFLFAIDVTPPEDEIKARHWHRKRRWLIFAELSALPAFATFALVSRVYFGLPDVSMILISMVLGGLGFGFALDALQFFVKRKIGMANE